MKTSKLTDHLGIFVGLAFSRSTTAFTTSGKRPIELS